MTQISAYHDPVSGPDGLCTLDGCGRTRQMHLSPELRHTRFGRADGPWPYGSTHDMDCPACVASGSSFTASPRSETYWSS